MGKSVHLYLELDEAKAMLRHFNDQVSRMSPMWVWEVRDKLKVLVETAESSQVPKEPQ